VKARVDWRAPKIHTLKTLTSPITMNAADAGAALLGSSLPTLRACSRLWPK
jgi:hypothetical protein